jgi:hypothetical protein
MVVLGGDEHLALAGEAAPWARVLDAVEVALEAQPIRVGLLALEAVAGADGTGGAGSERGGQLGLALLATSQAPADERVGIGVGAPDGGAPLDDHRFHAPTIPVGCDAYAFR